VTRRAKYRERLPATSADPLTATLTVASAGLADASTVVDVIAGAFLNDPTWSWAFPDPAVRRHWWKFCIDGALRYPWTFKTDGFETVSVWIPPAGTEFSQDGEQRVPALLKELVVPGHPRLRSYCAVLIRPTLETNPTTI
jgi:hypothetical protein